MEQENVPIIRIEADPTFWADVEIPMAGGKVGIARVEFIHKDRDEYTQFFLDHAECKDFETFPKIVKSWSGFDTEYSPAALKRLFSVHAQAAQAFIRAYRDNLFGAQQKN